MIVLTGVSGGIGKELLSHFLEREEKLFVTYNSNKPDLPENKNINLTQVDITDESSVLSWISKIQNELEKIVLINNAGITYNSMAHKSDMKQWKNVINVNLMGTFTVIRHLLPIMREQKYGRIINISSVVAQRGFPGTSAYAASKSALWGLTKTLAQENATKNITINTLNLGYMNTGMLYQIPESYQSELLHQIPLHKFGDISEVSRIISTLIESEYITGSSIDINGGLF